jgi:hypothetical protein
MTDMLKHYSCDVQFTGGFILQVKQHVSGEGDYAHQF